MKAIKYSFNLLLIVAIMASFSQCSPTQKLQNEAPTELGDVYSQKWTSGIKGGSSGINVFIPVKSNATPLDSIYFQGKKAKLEFIEGELPSYVGRMKTHVHLLETDVIMSGDSNKEYSNKAPIIDVKIPFELKDDECVISYKKGNQTHYFKILNIQSRPPLNYPSAPPNKQ